MRAAQGMPAAGIATLVGLGVFAGTVIGGDRSAGTVDRLSPPADPIAQISRPADEDATAAKKKRGGKPKVQHGQGRPVEIAPGQTSAISLQCPKRFPVPLSAGLDVSIQGIYASAILLDPDRRRSMLVLAANTSDQTGQWTATSVCAKGVKQV